MSRSKAVRVGVIECPLCESKAIIKKSALKSSKLFITCPECGALNNLSKNYQHHINRFGIFDDELLDETISEDQTIEAIQEPQPEPKIEKKSIFDSLFSE
mgnify:FL=1